jgi:hypothetical protein
VVHIPRFDGSLPKADKRKMKYLLWVIEVTYCRWSHVLHTSDNHDGQNTNKKDSLWESRLPELM